MDVHVTYPDVKARSFLQRNRTSVHRLIFLGVAYICLIINLCVGGPAWSLMVCGALCVLWVALLYKPLVENTLIKKVSDVGIAVCLYLFLLNSLVGGGWADIVVPIVFFSDLVVAGFCYLAFFKKMKRNFLPLFEMELAGLIAILCGLVGLQRVNWPLIVVGSVSLGLLLLSLILFFKPFSLEFQKKFHVR